MFPVLDLYATLSTVSPVFLIVCCITIALLIVNTILSGEKTPFEDKYTKSSMLMWISMVALVLEFIVIYPSLIFYTSLPALSISLVILSYIIVACVTADTVYCIYKKIQCYYFEKNLKRPPKEKDLNQELNQDMPKENDKLGDIDSNKGDNNFPLLPSDMENNDNSIL